MRNTQIDFTALFSLPADPVAAVSIGSARVSAGNEFLIKRKPPTSEAGPIMLRLQPTGN